MKPQTLTLTLLAFAVLAAGCKPSEEPSPSQQVQKVQEETKEAAQAVKDYSYAQKTEFVATMEAQLATINRELDALSAKIETASEATKAEVTPKVQALREQVTKLDQRLEEAKAATESTWDEVKEGFKKGYSEVEEGFQQMRQWVSDKIAP